VVLNYYRGKILSIFTIANLLWGRASLNNVHEGDEMVNVIHVLICIKKKRKEGAKKKRKKERQAG
jgi:hypothetical protein